MNLSNFLTKENLLSLIYVSFLLALGRLIPHPPNFTPILAAAIVVPYMVNNKWLAMLVPLIAMLIADLFLGLYSTMLWIYASILICTLLSYLVKNVGQYHLRLGVMAFISSIVFFVITNFSVWLTGSFYPKNLEGLIMCYTLAIPFFRNTIISTILYTGFFVLLLDLLKNTHFGLKLNKV